MFSRLDFMAAIAKRGLTLPKVADEIKMPYGTLYLKVNGEREFKISEMFKLVDVLQLTEDERDSIFFAEERE